MILKLRFPLVFNFLLISFNFTLVESVPEDYCLSPLNTSDCGQPPTPVFYYYKPGSRCEIKLWRGCPTENLFNTEYHCSHHCIGKLWSSEQDVKAAVTSKTSEINPLIGLKYRCDVSIDTSKCKQEKQFVYTYDNEKNKCTEVTYYGCPTENKFTDKEECEDACEISKVQWKQAVNNLDLDELNKLNDMLDEVNDEIEPEKEDLKKKVANSKVRPHTVSDYDEVTDPPIDETNKVDDEPKESTEKPEEPTDKSEEPTEKPEEPTEKPEGTTKAETETTLASTDSTQESTAAAAAETTNNIHATTKRTRKKRVTKTVKEGDVVRGGVNYYYK